VDIDGMTPVDDSSTDSRISRRSMLQRAAAVGMTLPAAGLLAACGDSSGGGATTGGAAPSGTVRFIKGPFYAKRSQDTQILTDLSRPFAREFPKIDVEYLYYDFANVQTTLTTQFAGGNPPDLVYLAGSGWPLFASKGALADLTDRVHAADYRDTYDHTFPKLWEGAQLDGKVYALPWVGGTFPAFVNRTLLEQADVDPDTWNASYDSLRAAARAVTRGEVHGFALAGTSYKQFSQQFWLPFVWGAGGDLFNADGTGGGLDNDGVVEAFEFLSSLYKDGYAPAPGQYDVNGYQALFTAGRLGIVSINSYVLDALQRDKSVKFDWTVDSPPPGPAGPSSIPLDYGMITVAAKAKAPEAAWEYAKFLTSAPAVTAYCSAFGPTLLTARDDTHVRGADSPKFARLAEINRTGRPYPARPQTLDAMRVTADQFELCITGKKSAQQAVQDANSAIDQLVS
jgi:ABC-type glycerol-3-phosphate transport system substrate-binding protein